MSDPTARYFAWRSLLFWTTCLCRADCEWIQMKDDKGLRKTNVQQAYVITSRFSSERIEAVPSTKWSTNFEIRFLTLLWVWIIDFTPTNSVLVMLLTGTLLGDPALICRILRLSGWCFWSKNRSKNKIFKIELLLGKNVVFTGCILLFLRVTGTFKYMIQTCQKFGV